jgi:hypothetical protein
MPAHGTFADMSDTRQALWPPLRSYFPGAMAFFGYCIAWEQQEPGPPFMTALNADADVLHALDPAHPVPIDCGPVADRRRLIQA